MSYAMYIDVCLRPGGVAAAVPAAALLRRQGRGYVVQSGRVVDMLMSRCMSVYMC